MPRPRRDLRDACQAESGTWIVGLASISELPVANSTPAVDIPIGVEDQRVIVAGGNLTGLEQLANAGRSRRRRSIDEVARA